MYPYINYCAIIWADNNNSHRDSILLLQKRIVRTCTNSMWLEHANPLFQSLNTLKIQDLHSLQVGIFMYQFHHNSFPDDLLEPNYFTMNNEVHNYNTRGATNIRVGLVNTCLASNTIRIQGALLRNILPTSLKNAPSINVSSAHIKRCSWTITTHSYVLLSRFIFCCLLVLDYIYHNLYIHLYNHCFNVILHLLYFHFNFFLIKLSEGLSAPSVCSLLFNLTLYFFLIYELQFVILVFLLLLYV